jgi:uncharacterized membrane protein YqaE (UPF0057 family)
MTDIKLILKAGGVVLLILAPGIVYAIWFIATHA